LIVSAPRGTGTDNPFRPGRSFAAYSLLPDTRAADAILDYGCGSGDFIAGVATRREGALFACDASQEAVSNCQARLAPRVECFQVQTGPQASLPFPNHFFQAITLCDVLEHVGRPNEQALLSELVRVLRPGGCLIITVPHRGAFAWADPENVKFRRPSLHRALYTRLVGWDAYVRRFQPDQAGYGNFTAGAMEHVHYSVRELESLCVASGLRLDRIIHYGFALPVVQVLLGGLEILRDRLHLPVRRLVDACWRIWYMDQGLRAGPLSYSVAVRARRP